MLPAISVAISVNFRMPSAIVSPKTLDHRRAVGDRGHARPTAQFAHDILPRSRREREPGAGQRCALVEQAIDDLAPGVRADAQVLANGARHRHDQRAAVALEELDFEPAARTHIEQVRQVVGQQQAVRRQIHGAQAIVEHPLEVGAGRQALQACPVFAVAVAQAHRGVAERLDRADARQGGEFQRCVPPASAR